MKWSSLICIVLLPLLSQGAVESSTISHATQYPGCQTEKLLDDLLRADYHAALSKYYHNREKAGFMALERFELALTRAIGDIRIVSYIKDLKERQTEALKIAKNWQQAFERAMVKNTLKNPLEKKIIYAPDRHDNHQCFSKIIQIFQRKYSDQSEVNFEKVTTIPK